MKRNVAYTILLLTVVSGLSALLRAQQNDAKQSDLIEPDVMDSLNRMGAYLRIQQRSLATSLSQETKKKF
jgi:hypothetical protein